MTVNFWKMHGLGNDFVIIDSRKTGYIPDLETRVRIADRRIGIGCDQLLVLLPPKSAGADVFMDIYNSDGGRQAACGNGTRCVARLLLDEGKRDRVVVETLAGLLPTRRKGDLIEVDLASPRFGWQDIPLVSEHDTLAVNYVMGQLSKPCCVNVGNPHAVFFVPDIAVIPLATLGPQIENHPLFPERTNVEVVQVVTRQQIHMRVWERGAGMTLACGSGACAVHLAAIRRGLVDHSAEVLMDGGSVWSEWREKDNRVLLIGPATYVCSGMLEPELLAVAQQAT